MKFYHVMILIISLRFPFSVDISQGKKPEWLCACANFKEGDDILARYGSYFSLWPSHRCLWCLYHGASWCTTIVAHPTVIRYLTYIACNSCFKWVPTLFWSACDEYYVQWERKFQGKYFFALHSSIYPRVNNLYHS